jgi:hypothetical protein
MARPAGYMVEIDNRLYRVIQKCDNFYGESINISLVDVLSEDKFHEIFIKNITTDSLDYSNGFHTINCLENLCVVDGVKTHFRPFRRLFYELINYFLSK